MGLVSLYLFATSYNHMIQVEISSGRPDEARVVQLVINGGITAWRSFLILLCLKPECFCGSLRSNPVLRDHAARD